MRTVIIVARDSMLSDLEAFLQKSGVSEYTIVSNVMGKDVAGRVYGTFLDPGINTIICAVLPSDEAAKTVCALKMLHAARTEMSHDDRPIPLKVFSFSCEEHV